MLVRLVLSGGFAFNTIPTRVTGISGGTHVLLTMIDACTTTKRALERARARATMTATAVLRT